MPKKLKCSHCGKRGKRICPVSEEPICPACCGSLRMSSIECTDECPHNPFGVDSYEMFLHLCRKFQYHIVEFMLKNVEREDVLDLLGRLFVEEDMTEEQLAEAMPVCAYFCLIFGPYPEEEETPLAKLWEEMDYVGLDNDERVMMEYSVQSFPSIIEIQKIEEGQFFTCVDLLDPSAEPFVVRDRTIAADTTRFMYLLTWMTPFPCYVSCFGRATSLPEHIVDFVLENIEEDVANLSSQNFHYTKHDALALNYGYYENMIFEAAAELRQQMLENIDIHPSMAIYSIEGDLSAVEGILRDRPEFVFDYEEDEEGVAVKHYVWRRVGESQGIEAEMPVAFRHDGKESFGLVGSLHLAGEEVALKAQTTQLYEFAKSMIPRIFGDLLQFREELVVDSAKQLSELIEEGDLDEKGPFRSEEPGGRVPREIEEQLMQDFYRRHYEAFLDDKVPALDDMTPREAAQNPQMRDKLVKLMKGHISSIEKTNRQSGMDIKIDWVLRELGLEELI